MEETENGSGKFTEVLLHPIVKITNSDLKKKGKRSPCGDEYDVFYC